LAGDCKPERTESGEKVCCKGGWYQGECPYCPVSMTGDVNFNDCSVGEKGIVGSQTGRVTISGTVHLSGTPDHPARLIFGQELIIAGGKIVLSGHQQGKPTALIIKAGTPDSKATVGNNQAGICSYYQGTFCGVGKVCQDGECVDK